MRREEQLQHRQYIAFQCTISQSLFLPWLWLRFRRRWRILLHRLKLRPSTTFLPLPSTFRHSVSGRISIPKRAIQGIRIAVPRLRTHDLRNQRVRLDETPNSRIVPSGTVVIQPAQALLPLSGEAVVRRCRAPGEAGLAKGSISQLAHPAAGGIRHDARRAQAIAEKIDHAVVARHRIALHSHGHTLSSYVVVETPDLPGRQAGRRAEGGRRGPGRCLSRSRG